MSPVRTAPANLSTADASLRAAYDALPEARKRELEDKVAIHHYAYSRRNGGYALTNEAEDKRFPPVPQAMIRANPVATWSSARSSATGLPSILACSRRPSRPTVAPSADPFEHSRPRLAGCTGSPRM